VARMMKYTPLPCRRPRLSRPSQLTVSCPDDLLALAGPAGADQMEIAGMLGMTPVPANAYVAIWIPVPSGQALAGVRWYNNDGNVVFPQILVNGGTDGMPAGLEGATVVASEVQGVSIGWSQVNFSQAFDG